MTRHVPAELAAKVTAVQGAVAAAAREPRRSFHVSAEVQPGVRLVVTQSDGVPIVFSLWSDDRDIAEVCGDAAYPSTSGLLAIDKRQTAELSRSGVTVDLAGLVRSETLPGMYYALLDHLSDRQLRHAVGRLVPAIAGQL